MQSRSNMFIYEWGFPHGRWATSANSLVTYFSPRGAIWRNHRPDWHFAHSRYALKSNFNSTFFAIISSQIPSRRNKARWSIILWKTEPCSSTTNKGNRLICVNVRAWDKDTPSVTPLLSHHTHLLSMNIQKTSCVRFNFNYLVFCPWFGAASLPLPGPQSLHSSLL